MEDIYNQFHKPSFAKFQKILKSKGINVSPKEIKAFIDRQQSGIREMFKKRKVMRNNLKFIVAFSPLETIQIDLIDYAKYSHQNKGNHYILVAIDIFSRYAWAEPIKNKQPPSVLDAFKKMDIKPLSVYHDDGNEYKGVFLEYLNENNIFNSVKTDTHDHNPLGVIDRYIQSLKSMIEKHFNENNTTNYVDSLKSFVEAYNDTPHSALGDETPNDAFNDDIVKALVTKINISKNKFNEQQQNSNVFNVGDLVRKAIKKNKLAKGYTANYSNDVYKIINIIGNSIELDDGTKEKAKDLLLATSGQSVSADELKSANKKAVIKRKLQREGI